MRFAPAILNAVALALLISWCAAPAFAGLHPALAEHFSQKSTADTVTVLVVMEDQADIPALDRSLRGAKAGRGHRHQTVIETLRTQAYSTQGPLLDELRAGRSTGRVVDYESHWLINAVTVTASVDYVWELADLPGVGLVEPHLEPELIQPVPQTKSAAVDSGMVGLNPSLEVIGATRVWDELGIDGSGTLVGIIDTGVDVFHPALEPRWRGNHVPLEEAWHDPINTQIPYPIDPITWGNPGHGTHVMGIICGQAPGDTIGVAPGAEWIASNAIFTVIGRVNSNVLSALEFMTDPDGDPSTTDDVPDVLSNSWGVTEAFPGYIDCDCSWYQAIDNVEAAGVIVMWSAGNEGPYDQTMRSPADRATTLTNAFSVGATQVDPPFTAPEWSSRGPSGCRGPSEVKPEVAAPGVEILSARVDGGYHYLSGTSMSAPHVAGVALLMRQANPDIEPAAIKEILMETAVDLGRPGEDNTYGHGMIDAYAAVLAVMETAGSIEGTITDAATGLPIEGAEVRIVGRDHLAITGADGRYGMTLVAETVEFTVSEFEFHDATFEATVSAGMAIVADASMDRLPSSVLTGTVLNPHGQPVAGAEIKAVGTPVTPAVTAADGTYALVLPKGTGRIYEIRASQVGFGPDYGVVELIADDELHFRLPKELVEDFERGDYLAYDWETWGDVGWTIEAAQPYQGAFSATSGDVMNDQYSAVGRTMYVSGASDISFWYRVSSEKDFDYLLFYVDDKLEGAWSGERDWTYFSLEIPRGEHTFAWYFHKDVAFSRGEDRGLIDLVQWPVSGDLMAPVLTLDSSVLTVTLRPGESRPVPLQLGNEGDLTLNWKVGVGPDLGQGQKCDDDRSTNTVPHLDLDKGEFDRRGGFGPLSGAGGPDRFGYAWVDETWWDGPVYDWTDIRNGGTSIGLLDDALHGPVNLGFTFRFYGQAYDQVWIGSNGNILFSFDDPTYVNQGIPDHFAPNPMIAVFWDDLDPQAGGNISYLAEPEAGRFTVQYHQVRLYETGAPVTCQAILEKDGTITFQYGPVPDTTGATMGIENGTGDDGLLLQFNYGSYVAEGKAIRFTPPAVWVLPDRWSGALGPAMETDLGVVFDATELEEGVHAAMLNLSTDDPDQPTVAVPLILNVNALSSADESDLPRALAFAGAVPNPFNPTTELHFSLPEAGEISLRLFDVSGRLVRVIHEGRLEAGHHQRPWDGRDQGGRPVASGSYFARLVTPTGQITKPLALVR